MNLIVIKLSFQVHTWNNCTMVFFYFWKLRLHNRRKELYFRIATQTFTNKYFREVLQNISLQLIYCIQFLGMAIGDVMLASLLWFYWILQDLFLYFGQMHFYLTDRIALVTEMVSYDFKGRQEIQFLIEFSFLLGDFNKQVIQFRLFIWLLFFVSIYQAVRNKLLFSQFIVFVIFNLFLCISPIFIINCPGRYLLAFHNFINLIYHSNTIEFTFNFNSQSILVQTLQVLLAKRKLFNLLPLIINNFITQMGGGICAQQNLSKLELNTNSFINSLKYYDSEREPVSNDFVDVYSYKTIFIQKKNYRFQSKSQLIKTAAFLTICARCQAGVQPIFHIHSQRDIKFKTNYSLFLYAEHLNFSFKSYLESFRAKGVALSTREIFYVLRQMVRAGSYLGRKKFWVKSFDPDDIYVSSTYQIKVPLENIIGHSNEDPQNIIVLQSQKEDRKEVLYLAPQQLIWIKKNRKDEYKNDEMSRVFSLGILIMQCCTMLDGAVSYYNYNSYSIDINKLNNDIKSVKDVTLAGILSRMLQIDYNKRIKFQEIELILSKLDESMFVNYLLIE